MKSHNLMTFKALGIQEKNCLFWTPKFLPLVYRSGPSRPHHHALLRHVFFFRHLEGILSSKTLQNIDTGFETAATKT